MSKLTEVSIKNDHRATYNHYCKLIYPLFLTLLALLLTSPVQAKYSGGSGEPNNPYQIATAEDLNDIGNHVEDFNKCFVMVNDINLAGYTGTEFNIIGKDSNAFAGVFDGNGHTISNFTYSSTGTDYCIGLFGLVYDVNAVIRGLTLIDPNINVDSGYFVGSLVGGLIHGKVSNCYVIGGEVRGYDLVGGLVGSCGADIYPLFVEVVNCGASVNVVGNGIIGGLIGKNFGGTISKCYATGNVSASGDYVGGLIGLSSVGETIFDSYATGDVSGNVKVGGLIGTLSWGVASDCFSCGEIIGTSDVGGLIGSEDSLVSYTSCFWDSGVNPDINGIGNTSDPNVIGKSTAEMQKENTFTDWDFVEIWNIGESQTYPYLRVYPAGDLNHDGVVNLPDFAIFADHWLAGVE